MNKKLQIGTFSRDQILGTTDIEKKKTKHDMSKYKSRTDYIFQYLIKNTIKLLG